MESRIQPSRRARVGSTSLTASALVAVSWAASVAQGGPPPAPVCPPTGQELVNPPEIQSAAGILRGTVYVVTEQQRLPSKLADGTPSCESVLVRNFRAAAPREPFDRADVRDPLPGPTLRARVGELVQLTLVNQTNPFFEKGLDIESCTRANGGGGNYPGDRSDVYPNCLHASSTANIHFHGTHTNPDSTGDDVYVQVRPLPRDNRRNLTTTAAQATAGLDGFFAECSHQLGAEPLKPWPRTWADLPPEWTTLQMDLLGAYQQQRAHSFPLQPLRDENQKALDAGGWPIYYIGAFPYCFALPDYPGRAGTVSPAMGQAPGTHWYHAHKHGSTAINVMNGMTGAFIIEGKYDDDLNAFYGSYELKGGPWNTRSQKVMVLNQLGTAVNLLAAASTPAPAGEDFVVNGLLQPKVTMQPGEVQLWRIVNTSGRTAVYFMPPDGLEWRQTAQDGVQYDDESYQASRDRPFYLAPANRVDLLVRAPMNPPPSPLEVRIQNIMALADVKVDDAGRTLLTVEVAGPNVQKDGGPVQMPFVDKLPCPPDFLRDITDDEFRLGGSITRTLVFNSKDPRSNQPRQHTINGIQFDDKSGRANLDVVLGAVEEWKVVNTTNFGRPRRSAIDHPLHIHVNPFQVTEVFDPNERIFDWQTKTYRPRYVVAGSPADKDQCTLDPHDESTWKECGGAKREGHWWDVSRIPAARVVPTDKGEVTIPGYFRMRSRFVDYPGRYVMHCHILIHEDRGMMYSVEVVRPGAARPHH